MRRRADTSAGRAASPVRRGRPRGSGLATTSARGKPTSCVWTTLSGANVAIVLATAATAAGARTVALWQLWSGRLPGAAGHRSPRPVPGVDQHRLAGAMSGTDERQEGRRCAHTATGIDRANRAAQLAVEDQSVS